MSRPRPCPSCGGETHAARVGADVWRECTHGCGWTSTSDEQGLSAFRAAVEVHRAAALELLGDGDHPCPTVALELLGDVADEALGHLEPAAISAHVVALAAARNLIDWLVSEADGIKLDSAEGAAAATLLAWGTRA